MIDTPDVTRTPEQAAAIIRLTIPRAEMQEVFGPAVDELFATLAAQGVDPAGPVFAHHLRMDPDTFDFELGVPVTEPVAEAGRVEPGTLPAATVARTVYRGPYEDLPEAWGEFTAWMEENGHAQGPNLWERYVVGPYSEDDPTLWRTELNRPLVGRGDGR